MSPLGDLFDEAEGRAARAAEDAWLTGDALGMVHTRVRRAHARRAALFTGLAAAAVVVVGAGALYGVSRWEAVPPSDAEPTSPATTPSPTASVGAWPGFAGTVSEDPHLPDASPLTPDVWDSVGPGWVLASYREAWTNAAGAHQSGPQVVYLAAPDGRRYELVGVPGDTVSVVAWEAGATTAAVSVQPADGAAYPGVLDLVTGAVTRAEGYAPLMWSLAFLDANGEPVWTGNDGTWGAVSVGPDGEATEFTYATDATAAQIAVEQLAFPGIDCMVVAPYDAESSLVSCWDERFVTGAPDVAAADARDAIARVWTAQQRVDVLWRSTFADGTASRPTRVGDHVVASTGATGPYGCPNAFTVISGVPDAVPGWGPSLHPDASQFLAFGAVGDVLTWGATGGCSPDASPVAVVASDLDSGRGTVLVPYPSARPAGQTPYQSVTGVAVGR